MSANVARYEMQFNLDDPIDAAIWAKLEPFLKLRRAAGVVRESLRKTLLPADGAAQPPLPHMPLPRASRPTPAPISDRPTMPIISAPDEGLDEAAADTFLSMFG